MADFAVPRTPGHNPAADAHAGAYQQWQSTGHVPAGYMLTPNGRQIVPIHGNDGGFLNKHGWELMAALVGGGTLGGLALGPSAAAAVPSIGATGGIPAGAFGTVAGTSGAGSAATAAGSAGMGFGIKEAAQLAPTIMSLFSGHHSSAPPQGQAMEDLIRMQTTRMQQSDPLYQAILKMAMGLMPASARGNLPGGR